MPTLAITLFPSRYIQGPDALNALRVETTRLGTKPLLVCDTYVSSNILPSVQATLDSPACEAVIEGPCCTSSVAKATWTAQQNSCDVVIGVGGGKVIDAAKLVAEHSALPLIVVPSIAATDAPCSAIAVLCNENGCLERYVFLKRSPDLVLVDTSLIRRAPTRMLVAGIGDALATWYEMEESRLTGLSNLAGGAIAELPRIVASHCRDTILTHSAAALKSMREGHNSSAFEAVVEANILLSGIGFESGGLGSAHAIQNGLAQLPQARSVLHGELVALGLLAMLSLKGKKEEIHRITNFFAEIGLPCSLAAVGLSDLSDEALMRAANFAATPGPMNRMPASHTPREVYSALRRL